MPRDTRDLEARVEREKGPETYWGTDPEDDPVQLPTKVGIRSEQMEDLILPSLGPCAAANVHKVPGTLFHLSKVSWLDCSLC